MTARVVFSAMAIMALTACSTASDSNNAGADVGRAQDGERIVVGGDRPVTVHVPLGYDPAKPTPLVLLLHGYGVSGGIEDIYLGLTKVSEKRGFLYAHPDGTFDAKKQRFWNATPGCCNYDGSTVDDSAYLTSVIDDISARLNVDPKRVFLVGHSNGGFMAYRFACDKADRIAAIVSLAGATFLDPSQCAASQPVSVLEVHGTNDDEVFFDGDPTYPSAQATVGDWATIDGCDPTPVAAASLDIDAVLAGAETSVSRYAGCAKSSAVELWSIQGGTHIPAFSDDSRAMLVDWLLAHPKL